MQIGEVIMWMGIPQLFLIPLVPKLMKLVSPRLLCAAGFGLFGLASFFSGVLNPDFAGPQFNQIQLLRALGQPMIMVTISLIATAYLQPQDAGSASSLFNILRNLGGAIGIALLATLLDSRAKVYFDYLREALVPTNPQVDERLAQLAAQLGSQQAALGKLSEITHQQAMIMAYNDAFHVIGMVLAVSMLAVLLTRSLPAASAPAPTPGLTEVQTLTRRSRSVWISSRSCAAASNSRSRANWYIFSSSWRMRLLISLGERSSFS